MNNDIATKSRLNAALATEGNMGFEHNDIVTVDVMSKAIAEGGGGGDGGSDLSIARVTVILGADISVFPSEFPILVDYVDPEYPEDNYSAVQVSTSLVAGTYNVPLYKGKCRIIINSEGQTVTTSGNAEVRTGFRQVVVITGDCTISIAYDNPRQ